MLSSLFSILAVFFRKLFQYIKQFLLLLYPPNYEFDSCFPGHLDLRCDEGILEVIVK